MDKLTIEDLSLSGKKVLIRVDFNVPLDKEGKITDDTRIQASLPTIRYALDKGAAVILMSHLGRPKGKVNKEYSLSPCASRLSDLLGQKVLMAPDCIGKEVQELAGALKPGQAMLLENLRFHAAEEHPEVDPSFAKQLATLADCYCNDAFGTAHRSHSSTVEVARYFPDQSAAGYLMQKEIRYLGKVMQSPKKPFYAILGGAKISSKIGVVQALLEKVDLLLIGGAMAYTFLKAKGVQIGDSLYEEDFLEEAKKLLNHPKLLLPQDHVIADSISESARTQVVTNQEGIPQGFQGVDIGPETVKEYIRRLKDGATVFWNGPLGVFECPPFAQGTDTVAKALASLDAETIVGGGDSLSAVRKCGLEKEFSHLSTGGGASLEYIEYGTLPGIEALTEKKRVSA